MPAPKKYREELRERAVRLVCESARPIAHVAQDLGVHRETLRLWVRQGEADAGTRNDRLTSDERERMTERAQALQGQRESKGRVGVLTK